MTRPLPSGIHLAETEDEKRAVYRFRYDVYVEEMGRYRATADHENRLLVESEDETGRIFYAGDGSEIVGTVRISWGGDGPFSRRQIEQYALAPFLAELPPEAITVGERGMIARHLRGGDVLRRLGHELLRFANDRRVQLCFGACEPHLLNLYLGTGNRTYSRRNINSPEAGYLIPLVFVPEDIDYLKSIGSPDLEFLRDFGDDARVPACITRSLAEGSAVMSRRLTSSSEYWGRIYGALSELEESRISALDGMTEEEAARCLGNSTIIECGAGDRVLKKGGVARNMFVVLDGTLEVREGETPVAVLGPGDVFGEMAFLLERPRTKDVYAATDGVRVLSLSEGTLRKMIENDPAVTATLLLNISKMLCLRLLKNA
ncbi:MAG: cyclic nucleotide-binding domain-containing protein [Planctomycetota bacterium]